MTQWLRFTRLLTVIQILVIAAAAQVVAESLYVIGSGSRVLRANLNGSGLEVVVGTANPHCAYEDFDVHESGAVYWAEYCSTPGYAAINRWQPGAFEPLLTVGGGTILLSLKLSRVGAFEFFYYSSSDGGIRLRTLDGSFEMPVVSGNPLPRGLAVDEVRGKLYWVEPEFPQQTSAIRRSDRFGTNVETFVSGLSSPIAMLSIDEENAMVYWTAHALGRIQRASVTTGEVETVLEGLGGPAGIAIHGPSRKLYWTEINANRVRRSSLDGAGVEDVLNLFAPTNIRFGPDSVVAVEKATWGRIKQLYR